MLFLFLTAASCDCDNDEPPISNCDLEPDGGPCFAFAIKYYYDKDEQRCKEFIWGGCDGVIPFHTLEECKLCTGSSPE